SLTTLSRIDSQPAPCRSKPEWTSVTVVRPASSSANVTSTRLASAGSAFGTNPTPIIHARATWRGGSHTSTRPQSHSFPSVVRSYQRPPSRGSRTTPSSSPAWRRYDRVEGAAAGRGGFAAAGRGGRNGGAADGRAR